MTAYCRCASCSVHARRVRLLWCAAGFGLGLVLVALLVG